MVEDEAMNVDVDVTAVVIERREAVKLVARSYHTG